MSTTGTRTTIPHSSSSWYLHHLDPFHLLWKVKGYDLLLGLAALPAVPADESLKNVVHGEEEEADDVLQR
jgi:hypothetical protein